MVDGRAEPEPVAEGEFPEQLHTVGIQFCPRERTESANAAQEKRIPRLERVAFEHGGDEVLVLPAREFEHHGRMEISVAADRPVLQLDGDRPGALPLSHPAHRKGAQILDHPDRDGACRAAVRGGHVITQRRPPELHQQVVAVGAVEPGDHAGVDRRKVLQSHETATQQFGDQASGGERRIVEKGFLVATHLPDPRPAAHGSASVVVPHRKEHLELPLWGSQAVLRAQRSGGLHRLFPS
ncbi:MAG: hypothetical protein EA350_03775 [Gemmatimonadales bacterium]|nr:MAG: hypothetical protein EA350_03775 [Gemmatimonadales bacterium]